MIQEVSRKLKHRTALDGLFRYAEFLNFGQIHIKFDPTTHLKAIIAVHNVKRGPAIGGCRMVPYQCADAALEDAMRLAYGMSFKSAMSDLPHGGAKAVLIAPKVIKDRKAYLHSFADFVESLGGSYVTAVDSGTSMEDMDIIAERTSFVTTTTKCGDLGNPSLHTATGVRRSIEAAVKFKLGRDSLEGIHVAIQGAGHVGFSLANELYARGAKLTMTDINRESLQRCAEEFNATVCEPEMIYSVHADVFSPCALGATLNTKTIHQLKATMIVGSANNQLAHHHHADLMHERGILYAPDFVANAGGLIYAAAMYDHDNFDKAKEQVFNIYETIMEVFSRSIKENRSTVDVAESIAMTRLR
jgi:leucine dehydrogenase